jgi:large repetitive protein
MKTFTQVVRLLSLFALIVFLGQTAKAQTMNPNDAVITYNSSAPPAQPAFGKIGKWVRTVRLNWNTSEYKCYIYKGVCYRLHFPKTYNPTANDGKKYPVLIFYHGIGEAGPITDNEISMFHGGQGFQTNVDNGVFDGYILIPQTQGGWGPYSVVKEVMDSLIQYNKADPFHIFNNGLSAGAQGVWEEYTTYPTYICGLIPMSGVYSNYTAASFVNNVKYTPIWHLHGGLDGDPAPGTAAAVLAAMQAQGANYIDHNYVTLGHDTWDSTWLEPDFYPFINRAYMSNPWPLFGRTKFCPGDNINVTLGVVAGLDQYTWRFNGTVIPTATTNTLTVTQAGTYDCQIRRGTLVSDWSHTPVQIIIQTPTITPPIQVSGLMSDVLPAADGKTSVNLTVPNASNFTSFIWEKVGSSTVLGTSPIFSAPAAGNYIVSVNTQFGCSSIFSPPFTVINANGANGPASVGNLVANSSSNTKVGLSWSLSPNQNNPATSFEVYHGTKKGGPYTLIAQLSPSTVTYTDTLLLPAIQYFYVIRAINGNAASPLSTEANATTLSDLTPPTAPTGLTIASTTSSSIGLSWTAATDNVSVTQYDIYINGVKSYITSQTSFIVNGLTHGQNYAFTVVAEDGSGNVSPVSNQVAGKALYNGLLYQYYNNLPTSMSVLPNFGTLTPAASGTVPNVDLSKATNTVQYAFLWQGYLIIPTAGTYFLQTSSDDGSRLWLGPLNGTASPYSFSGTPTINNDALQGTTSKNSAALSLQAGVYPIAIGYFQQGGGAAMSIAWRTPGQTSYVTVPNSAFMETSAAGAIPAAPTGITATATSYKSITVSWTDKSSNETGFEIYRSTSSAGPFSIITTAGTNVTSYIDATLSAATTYYYRVQAINANGSSGFDPGSIGGVSYAFYSNAAIGSWSNMATLNTLTPTSTGSATNVSLSVVPSNITTNYALKFQGTIKITTPGLYTFFTASDDGSDLYVGGFDSAHLVVKNDFLQGTTERSGTVNLAAGSYPLFVTYFQQGGGVALTTSYTKPGGSKTAIPDSVYVNALSSATTLALPAAPAVPTSFTGSSLTPAVVQLNWQDASPNITGYALYRSFGDSTHFQLLKNLGPVTSYNDSSLFGHSLYYYQVMALGVGGNSALTAALAVTTNDNLPVVSNIPNRSARYTTTTTITVTGTDADGDALAYTGVNLPAFATLQDNGNGTANLVLNPAVSDAGVYNGIGVSVNDGHGGVTNSLFNLNVNANYTPTITPIANQTVNTNGQLNIPINGADSNSADILMFKVSGVPGNYTLVAGPNGSDTLKISPTPASKGLATVIATVFDATGGTASDTFNVTVNYVDPSQKIYIRPYAGDAIGAPWNSLTGVATTNLVDANGNTTNVGITFDPWWWFPTWAGGQTTGNNSGIYPDAVLKDYFWWGISGGPDTAKVTLSGLDTSKVYSMNFVGSATAANFGGTVIYYVGTQSQSLIVENNTQNSVTFNSIKPNPDGTLNISMAKGVGVQSGYWNALVLTAPFDDGTTPLTPTALVAQNISGHGIQLNWNPAAYNAKSYQVYRATNAAGPFNLVTTINQPAANFYLDSPVNGNIQYYYLVNATNSHGVSNNSDTAAIVSLDRIPVVNPVSNVLVKGGQTATVNIVAVDDATDHLTLTATGLPAYASFVDNGNGTATISVNPQAGNIGTSAVTVTATDLSDSSNSVNFNITVTDANLTSVYLNFSPGPITPAPWNTITSGGPTAGGFTYSGFKDDSNNPTTIGAKLINGFTYSVQYGMRLGNGNGIYPNTVLRNNFFETSTRSDSVQITGLNPALMYNFVFFASHDDGIASVTNFKIGTTTVTLDASYNTNKTVAINAIKSDANGNITFSVTKASTATWGFLNALVIQSYQPTVALLAPSDLRVITTHTSSISLQWADRSSNETGFELWRSVNGGAYSLLKSLGANVITYKDSALTPNNSYYYIVRSVLNSSTKSSFTSPAGSTTYAYSVDINVTDDNLASSPWNNLASPPQLGETWNNYFNDESGKPTSLGLLLDGAFGGVQPVGMNTGNNSGVYPDLVLAREYLAFPGQTGAFQISGLDLNMKYDISFMPSINIYADNTTYYAYGTDTVIQSGTFNINYPATMYGVSPDSHGNIQVNLGLYGASEEGLVNAMVVNGYNNPTSVAPVPPINAADVTPQATTITTAAVFTTPASASNGDSVVSAYPNPFKSSFTLTVPAEQNDRVSVLLYDVTGATVYQKEFTNLNQGANYLEIEPSGATKAGVYIVKLVSSNGQSKYQVIKVIKM